VREGDGRRRGRKVEAVPRIGEFGQGDGRKHEDSEPAGGRSSVN
jgi:hypothetical protein